MKLLLDECVSRRFATVLSGHEAMTVRRAGWSGKKNGELLKLAATRFDAFVTIDRGIAYQQNRTTLPLPVIVLRPKGDRLPALLALAPKLLARLEAVLDPVVFVDPS